MNVNVKELKNNGKETAILLAALLISRKVLEFAGDKAGPKVEKYLPYGYTLAGLAAQFSPHELVAKLGQAVGVVGIEASIRSAIQNPDGTAKAGTVPQFIAKALPKSSGLGNVPILPPMRMEDRKPVTMQPAKPASASWVG